MFQAIFSEVESYHRDELLTIARELNLIDETAEPDCRELVLMITDETLERWDCD